MFGEEKKWFYAFFQLYQCENERIRLGQNSICASQIPFPVSLKTNIQLKNGKKIAEFVYNSIIKNTIENHQHVQVEKKKGVFCTGNSKIFILTCFSLSIQTIFFIFIYVVIMEIFAESFRQNVFLYAFQQNVRVSSGCSFIMFTFDAR